MARKARIPAETLLGLRSRLASLPARAPARREEIGRIAELFGVSSATVYRSLQELHRPKDLRRAAMEEIGHRSTNIELAGLGKDAHPFIDWLLKQCLAEGTKPNDVISVEAREFLAEKLNTPLQIAEHLNRAFTDASPHGGRQRDPRDRRGNDLRRLR